MTASIIDLPEYLSSPTHSVDFDSVFDQHISQIHFDQDSTCSVNNNPKHDIIYTPSPLTTPDIASGSDPARSPSSNDDNAMLEPENMRNVKPVPDVISTYPKNQGTFQEAYPQNNVDSFAQGNSSIAIQQFPSSHDQNGTSHSSSIGASQIPHVGASQVPSVQHHESESAYHNEPKFFQQNGPYTPDFQCNHPRQAGPYTYDPFVNEPQDPLSDNFNQIGYNIEDSEMSRQKRRLSMPFVSTCQTPRPRYPREMRRFSAPHTTSENQRAMQYAMAARARKDSLSQRMMYSQMSQHWLQDWDRKMGLSKAHSRTMIKTEKSRRKLQKLNSI